LYLDIPNVGSISKENIGCHFTKSSFDLIVNDLHGKNYRLLKDNLDKDIDPEKSKYLVKKNKITIKLAKVKAEYGSYDSWQNLSSKKSKKSKEKMKTNPSDSIMDMMKDMYDSGDDNMRKVIGETMLKQRNGELGKNQDMPSYPGMDNMDI
jgi:calcyclin binding protein